MSKKERDEEIRGVLRELGALVEQARASVEALAALIAGEIPDPEPEPEVEA